jgi:UPF0271 protein
MTRIDLNCDMGESFGAWTMGDDEAIMRAITSANVACGAHAGDPAVMRKTVRLAREHGVSVGAHPSLPDLAGFGRREMNLTPPEVEGVVLYQMGALAAIARAEGVALRHVKPHGALYNMAARDGSIADAIARAVCAFDPSLVLFGLAGSLVLAAGAAAGLRVASEVFADRAYERDGSLASRRKTGAVVHDPQRVAARAVEMVRDGRVVALSGESIAVKADTICIHGDTPGAAELARRIRAALEDAGVDVRPVSDACA